MKLKIRKQEIYPIIPNGTIANGIGKDRWNKILNWIEKKYGTRKVILGYHTKGEGAIIYLKSPTGRCLGTLSKVEKLANKRRK